MPLRLFQPPGWVYPGAKYDFDFAGDRYCPGSVFHGSTLDTSNAAASLLYASNSGAPANTLYTPGADGIYRTGPQYSLRFGAGLGLWLEGSAPSAGGGNSNYALWCRDLTNAAWTKTNVTATKNQVGCDGVANSATLLTATANNGTVLQAITLSSQKMISSAVVYRSVGTGAVSMTLDGGSTYTDVTPQIGSTYAQCSVPAQILANPNTGFKFASSGDAIVIDFYMCENNDRATSPILTTTASLSRAPENAFMMGDTTTSPYNAGQHIINTINSGHPATVLIAYAGKLNSINGAVLYGDAPGGIFVQANGNNGTVYALNSSSQVVATANTQNAWPALNKVCVRYTGAATGLSICLNGGAIAKAAGSFSPTQSTVNHGSIGNRGNGDSPLNGYFSRLTLWQTELSDGDMIRFTS